MKATAHNIKGYRSVTEALEASNLLFNPVKVNVQTAPVSLPDGNVVNIDCADHCAIVRDDTNTVLSVMGKDYTAFRTDQTFAIADTLMQQKDLELTRAVETDGGRRIMIELMGKATKQIGKDTVNETFQIVDSFDGSKKFHIRYGFFRLVCTNGLMIGEVQAEMGVRHTKHAQDRLAQALRTYQRAALRMDEVRMRMEALTQKRVDKAMVEKFIEGLIGKVDEKSSTRKQNQRNDILYRFEHGRGNSGQSAWDLYNGVVEYYQHIVNPNNDDARLASHLFETGHKQSQKAFALAESL